MDSPADKTPTRTPAAASAEAVAGPIAAIRERNIRIVLLNIQRHKVERRLNNGLQAERCEHGGQFFSFALWP